MIEIKNLYKSFGEVEALKYVSLNIKSGEMFGIVGPDGAGKTTLIKSLCGLIDFNVGKITVGNLQMPKQKKNIQNKIGYLSQQFSLYGDLSIDENIRFFAEIHDFKKYRKRRDKLLKMTRLIKFRSRLAEKLSGGMKQKLALACALIHEPEILILDEPTTGVDPVSRRDFWKILFELLKDGLTVIMTTPYLDEAERCSRIALMHQGKFIDIDTPQNIKAKTNKIVIEIIPDKIDNAFLFLKNKYKSNVQIFGDRINIIADDYQAESGRIINTLREENIKVMNIRETSLSLENVFIHLITSKKNNGKQK